MQGYMPLQHAYEQWCVKTKKGEEKINTDVVLSAVGITPNIENIGLEDVGIQTENGRLVVDEYYNTNISGYYAIGDITAGPALAHVASAEGILCVEKIAGMHVEAIDYGNIPGCTYCSPEIASVGMTEQQAKEAGGVSPAAPAIRPSCTDNRYAADTQPTHFYDL